jgi:hypothetical protein
MVHFLLCSCSRVLWRLSHNILWWQITLILLSPSPWRLLLFHCSLYCLLPPSPLYSSLAARHITCCCLLLGLEVVVCWTCSSSHVVDKALSTSVRNSVTTDFHHFMGKHDYRYTAFPSISDVSGLRNVFRSFCCHTNR